MRRLNVNPTRMELTKLKRRLTIAVRGHKLLKDKQDEMIRQFIELVRKNNEIRKSVEEDLMKVYKDFILVGAINSSEFLEEAVMIPKERVFVEIGSRSIMNVKVPKMAFKREKENEDGSIFPYGFFGTSDELDRALSKLFIILPRLLDLGEIEKTCNLLAAEIEKTRRRVNALEYMTIPQLKETIRYIRMKLDENERSTRIRLMKVKNMLAEMKA